MNLRHSKSTYKKKGKTVLDKLLNLNKISKKELCRVLRISEAHLYRISNDYVRNLTMFNLYTMSAVFGLRPSVLLHTLERDRLLTVSEVMALEDEFATASSLVQDDDAITPDSLGLK